MKKWMVPVGLSALVLLMALVPARGEGPVDREAPGVECNDKKDICPGGRCHENQDGVKVCLGAASSKKAKMNPGDMKGDVDSMTNVSLAKGSKDAKVTGLDGNDSVAVGNNSTAEISGTGGTVSLDSASTVRVSCSQGEGAQAIQVMLESGTIVYVFPGGSACFQT